MITLTQKMIDFIYQVERGTDAHINALHKAKCMHFHNLKATLKPYYLYDGEKVYVNDGYIYLVENMPVLPNDNHNPMWIKSYNDAVEEGLISSMVLYTRKRNSLNNTINGAFDAGHCIKDWDNIFIVKNYNYYYIIIDKVEYENNQVPDNLFCIVSPKKLIRIKSDYANIIPQHYGFTVNIYDGRVYRKPSPSYVTGNGVWTFMAENEDKLTDFKMEFYNQVESKLGIKRVYKELHEYRTKKPYFYVKEGNNNLKIETSLFLLYNMQSLVAPTAWIETLTEKTHSNIIKFTARNNIGIMENIYLPQNLSYDNCFMKNTEEQYYEYLDQLIEGTAPGEFQQQCIPLDLTNAHTLEDKWYTIMQYNPDLYKKITGEEAPLDDDMTMDAIKKFRYTGAEIRSMSENNTFHMNNFRWLEKFKNTSITTTGYCNALVFLNGEIINTPVTTTMTDVSFKINEITFKDTDIFEIYLMSFDDSDKFGVYHKITLNENHHSELGFYAKELKLHLNNVLLFEHDRQPDAEWNFTGKDTGNLEYMINYSIKYYMNDTLVSSYRDAASSSITAVDDKYKNNPNSIRYLAKNQFHKYTFTGEEDGQLMIDFPDEFRYCHELSHYYLIINGRRIEQKYLKLALPKHDNGIFEMRLFTQVPINKGDKVQVYFLQPEMIEVLSKPTMNKCSVYTLTEEEVAKLPAPLSTDWYWFYLDGKKVLDTDVSFPSNDTIVITDSTHSLTTANLSVVFVRSLINGCEESVVTPKSDNLDGLSDQQIADLYSIPQLQNAGATNIYTNAIPREDLLQYIVGVYYGTLNNSGYMSYNEVFPEEEAEVVAALSSRIDQAGNTYSAYKVGSYKSTYDENKLS